jgi:preprotein translocase subunit YajC
MELLDFFIASAHAQDAATPQGGLMSFLPLIIIFVIFYFLLIRPQMKRAKEHKNLVAALGVGDEVVTNGGLLGKITKVGESFITLEVGDNVKVKLQRHAVASVMPKGTIKSS